MKLSETTTTALKTALKSGNKAWKQARSSTYLTALRKIPLTGLGRLVLLGGLASLGAYLAWDWAEAAAIMFAALLALLAAVAQTWGGGELALRVTVAQDRLRKGQELIGRAVATNNGRRAVRALKIELPLGTEQADIAVPTLRSGKSFTREFQLQTRRREKIVVGPPRTVREDILGLIRRVRSWPESQDVYVYPNFTSALGALSGYSRDMEGATSQVITSSDAAFHALRPYESGDDRRHIHWKMSAHTGQLMMRQYLETRRSHHLIVLDLKRENYREADFELAVEAAASLAVSSLSSGQPLTLYAGKTVLKAATARAVLDFLTEVQPAEGAPDYRHLVRWALAHEAQASVCSLICGPGVNMRRLQQICLLPAADMATTGIRADAGATLTRRGASSRRLLNIGELSQLPPALSGGSLA
ncbi:DUF58 domain-containing protein [Varibaculum cambriense]|uniref:DUF58 domain-containing protein n=1 Tax=Varibaculum cambriense TaxID=184870 RepID=UPI0003B676C8|nr:DUF58 domain-containing protein [Varibaculum cambriense]MDU5615070.1 DUF58 domain-containing protein [Varibaculum cambriense]MDU7407662.1 DUF58 domain-containing protein [Varibaculum cambriense]